nr:hypothetical protein [Tanacetum cinerariifolium]
MQIISALQARTLLYHGCEGFLATIHDTTTEVPSIHDQPIVSEFPDVFPDEYEYGKQDRKAAVLYEYETFKATERELFLETYIRYLQVINDLKMCGYSKDNCTITGTLFIYGHAVFVLFDTGATHSVISSTFASRITTTPMLLDRVLCISTPIQDSVRITHVYSNLALQFDDKIRAINAFPLDMCEFDLILGMDWLTEHHATIDCHSYRVIFGDIHAPEYTYHGSLPRKPMQIILALQARTLLYHGCEGFLATIHDTTSEILSIHDQPIVLEFPDVFPDELPGYLQFARLSSTSSLF